MSICYINGSFEDKSSAVISIQDRGFNFSDGVYEVMSFCGLKIINYERHIKRLNKSLLGLKIKKPMKNFKSLELIIKKLIKLNNLQEGFLYLQITRGTSSRNHLFPESIAPNVVIFTFTTKVDKNMIKNGVRIRLTDDLRWKRCDIKSISLLPNVLEKQTAHEKGMYESWQKNGQFVTEGSTSNAFIVNSNGEIQTHPTNNLILGGVTRDTVIEIAKNYKFIVKEKPFTTNELFLCKEAFLTSTTVRILPVTRIDNKKINGGEPGKITQFLIQKYDDLVTSHMYV